MIEKTELSVCVSIFYAQKLKKRTGKWHFEHIKLFYHVSMLF